MSSLCWSLVFFKPCFHFLDGKMINLAYSRSTKSCLEADEEPQTLQSMWDPLYQWCWSNEVQFKQEQTCSLPRWPQLGMVSAVWGVSVFENEISARLVLGLNFCKCLMYKNCPWSFINREWNSLIPPIEIDFLCKQQVAFAKANIGPSNSHSAGSQFSCLCFSSNRLYYGK